MESMRLAIATLGLLATTAAAAQPPLPPVEVPVAADLRAEGRAAERSGRALVLVFASEDCSYCMVLEEEILKPMLRSGEYDHRIRMRKVMLDAGESVVDFAGEEVETAALADRYGVFVTPTVLFVDAEGTELATRLVGINTVELYGGYMDAAIDQAVARIEARARLARHAADEPGTATD